MPWGVQSLQAVWWATQPLTRAAPDLFSALVGGPPSTLQQNPSTSTSVAIGALGTSAYRLQVQANRLDFFANPLQTPNDQFPLFTDIADAIRDFSTKLQGAIAQLAVASSRLAVVVNVCERENSLCEANDIIAGLAGLRLPADEIKDVIFQVNRRRTTAGVELNRILKWSVDSIQLIELSSGVPRIIPIDVATVSVDVNVVPASDRIFQPADQITIFQALIAECQRLCDQRSIDALQMATH